MKIDRRFPPTWSAARDRHYWREWAAVLKADPRADRTALTIKALGHDKPEVQSGRDWNNWKAALFAIRDRLADVMIYERDAMEFIGLMSSPDSLIYVDPPYHIDTRTRGHGGSRYAVEFGAERHGELVAALLECPAMVVLSGYPHASYDPLEKAGWSRVDKDYRANMSARRRTECLWISPTAQCQKAAA